MRQIDKNTKLTILSCVILLVIIISAVVAVIFSGFEGDDFKDVILKIIELLFNH